MPHPHASVLDSPGLLRHGLPELVYGTTPAPGANYSAQVPGQYYARLVSLFVRLVTDANVADRQVVVEYQDAESNRFGLSGHYATQAASLPGDWYFSAFQPLAVATVDTAILIPLSPILLMPTHKFQITVVNIQATDQLSRIRYVWELFDARGFEAGFAN